MHLALFVWFVFKVYKMAYISIKYFLKKIKINNVEMFCIEQLHMYTFTSLVLKLCRSSGTVRCCCGIWSYSCSMRRGIVIVVVWK